MPQSADFLATSYRLFSYSTHHSQMMARELAKWLNSQSKVGCGRWGKVVVPGVGVLMVVVGQWWCVFRSGCLWLTGDVLGHELPVLTFRAAYQPMFQIVVAPCKRATCSPTKVINEDDFFLWHSQKSRYWHLRLGLESMATSQAVWLSKTHKRRPL